MKLWLVVVVPCTLCLRSTTRTSAFVPSLGRPFGIRTQHGFLPMARNNDDEQSTSVRIDARLSDGRVTELFAWLSRAFAGDAEYNNLMLAMAAVFGDLAGRDDATGTMVAQLKERALRMAPQEEELVGEAFSTDDREMASLGAMGAGQWTGQYQTRPHALLDLSNYTNVDDWVRTLPRGCRRTLKKALAQNFTVGHQRIRGHAPAPHSALAHFRCVMAHEVRLLTNDENDVQGFLDALAEGVSRYMGTTRMAGDIYEYRRGVDGTVMAIAHEVRKGGVLRGQWFYANDEASQNYVWFHSVYRLVERAMATEGVHVVDLGPSGSDAFSQLKSKYGFVNVADWTRVADYTGPFYQRGADGTDLPARYERQLQDEARFYR